MESRMNEPLYRPEHVEVALDRLGNLDGRALEAVLRASPGRTKDADYIPSEALVRLLRRFRIEGDRRSEDFVFGFLMQRVSRYTRQAYSGLSPASREDLSQNVLEVVAKKIASPSLDYWEITFDRNLKRAAANAYQEHFAKDASLDGLEKVEAQESDGGAIARDLVEKVLLQSLADKVLTTEELRVFHPMFLLGLPIKSTKASRDLVRETGRPEGTLAEMKTVISRKLEDAMKDIPSHEA